MPDCAAGANPVRPSQWRGRFFRTLVWLMSVWLIAGCAASHLPLTIVTLGDSLTYGDQDTAPRSDGPEGGGWPLRLLSPLRQVRPQTRLVNLALPGWTSGDVLYGRDGAPNQIDQAIEEFQHAARNDDKIATVWIGVNDLFYLYEFDNPTPAVEAQNADRVARDLEEIVSRLSGVGAQVYLALLHDPAQGRVQTSGGFQSINAEEWIALSRQTEKYNAAIRAIAAEYHAQLVDIPASQIFNTAAWIADDGIHPNSRGYDELARVWLAALQHE
jgi:lysophospholipase L1-like esterase